MLGLVDSVREALLVAVRVFNPTIPPSHANLSSAVAPDQEETFSLRDPVTIPPLAPKALISTSVLSRISLQLEGVPITLADAQGPDLAASEVRGFEPARDCPNLPSIGPAASPSIEVSYCNQHFLLLRPAHLAPGNASPNLLNSVSAPRDQVNRSRCIGERGSVTVLEGKEVWGPYSVCRILQQLQRSNPSLPRTQASATL